MSNIRLRNYSIECIVSLFVTIVFNLSIRFLFDYYIVIPYFLYIETFILEYMLVFELCRIVLRQWSKRDKYIFTCCYFALILSVLMLRYEYTMCVIQLNPLACLREIYYGSYKEWIIFFFNALAFVPVPFFVNVYVHNFKRSVCISFSLACMIELTQLVTHRGVFDLGDIALYSTGILVGCILYKMNVLDKIKRKLK